MKAGFISINERDYHADKIGEIPTLNHGTATTLVAKSPEHAWQEHPRFGAASKEETNEMSFGDVVHQLILGKGQGIAIFEGKTWQGKEAGAFWDHAVSLGKTPVLLKVFKRAEACCAAFRAKIAKFPELQVQFGLGRSEQVMVWNEGPVWFRAMCDKLFIDEGAHKAVIFDVKTTDDARERCFANKVRGFGYDLQFAQYTYGLQALRPDLAGRVRFIFLTIETSPPFALVPYELDGEWRAIGVSRYCRAISLWTECLKQNRWPGLAADIVKIVPKSWELTMEFGEESLGEKMEKL